MADVRMDYLEIVTPILAGSVARTVELRSDLRIDVDVDGYVLGVERDGDDVRMLDLEEVVRELRHVEPPDPSKVLVISGCGHWWRESRPEGLTVDPEQPRVCALCKPTHRHAVGTSPQGLGLFNVVYLDGYDEAARL